MSDDRIEVVEYSVGEFLLAQFVPYMFLRIQLGLAKLAEMLREQFRVIVPDLPGFGDSSPDLPDYSFLSHAEHLLQLLDRLGVREAQFVGFSMGGGVVLSVADLAPERVRSLVMLSAIGVQEDELTGSYWLNHLLHAVQLVGL